MTIQSISFHRIIFFPETGFFIRKNLLKNAGQRQTVLGQFFQHKSLPGVDVMITIFCDFSQLSAKNWRFS
jgi:hypothetical protein